MVGLEFGSDAAGAQGDVESHKAQEVFAQDSFENFDITASESCQKGDSDSITIFAFFDLISEYHRFGPGCA